MDSAEFDGELRSKFGDLQAFPRDLQRFFDDESAAAISKFAGSAAPKFAGPDPKFIGPDPKFANGQNSAKNSKKSADANGGGIDFNPEEFHASMKRLLNFNFDEAASSGSEMGSYEDEMSFREEGIIQFYFFLFFRIEFE